MWPNDKEQPWCARVSHWQWCGAHGVQCGSSPRGDLTGSAPIYPVVSVLRRGGGSFASVVLGWSQLQNVCREFDAECMPWPIHLLSCTFVLHVMPTCGVNESWSCSPHSSLLMEGDQAATCSVGICLSQGLPNTTFATVIPTKHHVRAAATRPLAQRVEHMSRQGPRGGQLFSRAFEFVEGESCSAFACQSYFFGCSCI